MHLDTYQQLALQTRLPTANRVYSLLGLTGEVGELQGYLAKQIRDGFTVDEDHVKKEIGDILWFVAAIAEDFGLTLSSVADANITKLQKRQQKGTLGGSGSDRD